jgi:hypothetical protein
MLLVVQAVQLLLLLQPGLRDGASSSAAREASDLADELANALVAVEDPPNLLSVPTMFMHSGHGLLPDAPFVQKVSLMAFSSEM